MMHRTILILTAGIVGSTIGCGDDDPEDGGPTPVIGVLDADFGGGGKVTTQIGTGDETAYGVVLQSDGKILVAGSSHNGTDTDFAVVRYTTTGALDGSFGTGGKVTTPVGSGNDFGRPIVLQSDGKIVVAGSTHNGSDFDFAVVRYTTTGALDGSFGSGGKVTTPIGSGNDIPRSVRLQSDGKVVAAGYSHNGTNYDFAIVRYDTAGVPDGSFGAGGKVTTPIGSGDDEAWSMALQPDGKIVLAGSSYNGTGYDLAVVRYDTAGVPDGSFGSAGKVTTPVGAGIDQLGQSVALQSDGKIVVAGSTHNGSDFDFAVVRYDASGVLDGSFGSGGKVTTPLGSSADYGWAVTLQSDGRIILAGFPYNGSDYDFGVVRYTASGTPDGTFGTGGIVTTPIGSSTDQAFAVALQSDGKIVVAGSASNGSNSDFAVVRYK